MDASVKLEETAELPETRGRKLSKRRDRESTGIEIIKPLSHDEVEMRIPFFWQAVRAVHQQAPALHPPSSALTRPTLNHPI